MNSTPLKKDEIKKYVSGKMSPLEQHSIEMRMLEDELYSDAMEGYALNPSALKQIPNLKKQLNIRFPFMKNSLWNTKILIISFSSFAVIAVAVIFLKTTGNNNIPTEITAQKDFTVKQQENGDTETGREQVPLIEENERITYQKLLSNRPATIEDIKGKGGNTAPEKEITPIPPISPKTSGAIKDEAKEQSVEKVTRSNAPVDYILDLKIVDYSRIYGEDDNSIHTGGVAARYENVVARKKLEKDEPVSVYSSYRDFLKQALEKFIRNDFAGAGRDLSIILEQNPNDVNACFYSGLCLYNMDKPDQAEIRFDCAAANYINTFDQEALWFKSLSLIRKGDVNTARKLLQQIMDDKGFYSERAAKKMKEL